MNRRHLIAAGLAAPAVLRTAWAQSGWPDRPVRLIVPWPPGGSTDTVARIMQQRLGELLGRPLVIENKGGASGAIGAGEAARAAPDGYTFVLVFDTQATNETVMRLPFSTMRDFAPVSLIGTGPMALVAHKDQPFRSFADVVAAAKQRPEDITYATSGVGGLAHVATTRLQQVGGFRLTHVPYRGGGPATQAAIANEVPLFMSNVVAINQHVRAGTLRPLGQTAAGRTRHVEGVPSFQELGMAGFEALTWWALLAPARTPEPIIRGMHERVVQTLADPTVRQRIEEQGADVIASTPAECGRFLEAEIAKWGEVIRANNIRADS
jgi:tripartite-type tricarboxylate transporter receptor subunit TctC